MYQYISETLGTINEALTISFPYNDEQWLKKTAQSFTREGRSALDNCCGALDGIAIKIEEPTQSDVANSSSYFNRKGWFALNVQAMCDSFYRFTFVSCMAAGSTHDSTAFRLTKLYSLLQRDTNSLMDTPKCRKKCVFSYPRASSPLDHSSLQKHDTP